MTEYPPPPENYPPPPPGGYYPPPPGPYPRDPGSGYPPPPPSPALHKDAYTPWVRRLLAFLIHWTPIWILVAAPYVVETTEYGASCAMESFAEGNGKTGQSIGKSVLKFKVVSEKTWQPIGFGRSFLRQLAHYVDQLICYIDFCGHCGTTSAKRSPTRS
jgi:uncharacterized RDD family membrane protein YckC